MLVYIHKKQYKWATKQQDRATTFNKTKKKEGEKEMELGNGWDMLGYVHAIHGRQPLRWSCCSR
jgi:hypothetical protein